MWLFWLLDCSDFETRLSVILILLFWHLNNTVRDTDPWPRIAVFWLRCFDCDQGLWCSDCDQGLRCSVTKDCDQRLRCSDLWPRTVTKDWGVLTVTKDCGVLTVIKDCDQGLLCSDLWPRTVTRTAVFWPWPRTMVFWLWSRTVTKDCCVLTVTKDCCVLTVIKDCGVLWPRTVTRDCGVVTVTKDYGVLAVTKDCSVLICDRGLQCSDLWPKVVCDFVSHQGHSVLNVAKGCTVFRLWSGCSKCCD